MSGTRQSTEVIQLLASRIDRIHEKWLDDLNAGGLTARLLEASELFELTRQICTEVVQAIGRGNLSDIRSPEYGQLRRLLGSISRKFATHGLSPSDTASFVFSIKATIMRVLTQEGNLRPDDLIEQIVRLDQLFDALGLVTFEAYAEARETLITEQNRQLEEATRLLERRVAERTAELRAINEELEAFCYSVSHDLQAPLRSLVGYSHALVEDFGDELPAVAKSYLDHLVGESRRMGGLIDDLLALSRVSRTPIIRRPVDLSAMAHEVIERLRIRQPDRRVEFDIEDGLTALGDVNLLRILLENLLGNAWKFTREAERPRIRFTADRDGEVPAYSVSDNDGQP